MILRVKLADIIVCRQIRDNSQTGRIYELAASIKKLGLLQPLTVIQRGKFYVLDGTLRYYALLRLRRKTCEVNTL